MLLLCFANNAFAQNNNAVSEMLQLIEAAEKQISKEQYDSALLFLNKAEVLVLQKKIEQEPSVAILYNSLHGTIK